MDSVTQETLEYWRSNPIRETDVPFEEAVRSLNTDEPMVELKLQSATRWTFYIPGSDSVAVFSYAGLFSLADDYYTGNLVPAGNDPPEGLVNERIERFANYKCNYAYAIDTSHDKSMFHLQQMLEEYVRYVDGFNPGDLPRREYQTGQDPSLTWRYWMRVPMFIRMNEGETKPPLPSNLHPWVISADRRSRIYRANPARPSVFALEDNRLRDIRKCAPNTLQRGDVILFTFTVSFVVGPSAWYPQILPLEIVRVASANYTSTSDAAEYALPSVDDSVRPGFMDGELINGTE
ncbi:hypothetical protein OH77DRAFT_1443665 [Trametes cingulata]|nr:hypothetical protein OH77DRAFT_1443665 [Trametes cingulata]